MAVSVVAGGVDRLRTIRSMPLVSDVPKILAILTEMSSVEMTLDLLKQTGVGVEVNNKFYRHHTHKHIKQLSARLIAQWRACAAQGRDPFAPLSSPTSSHMCMASPTESVDRSEVASAPGTPLTAVSAGATTRASTGTRKKEEQEPAAPEVSAEMSSAEFLARCKANVVTKSPPPRQKRQSDLKKTPERKTQDTKATKKSEADKRDLRKKSAPDVFEKILKRWQSGKHVLSSEFLANAVLVGKK